MLPPTANHWTTLLNFIINNYLLTETSSICIIWNKDIEFELNTPANGGMPQFIGIQPSTLSESFAKDVYNFTAKEEALNGNGMAYDDMIKKLTVAIESSHCESFIAFQDDIPLVARAFCTASIYSIWRTNRSKFLFVYRKDLRRDMPYFDSLLFEDQPNILIVEAEENNSTNFNLITNKFVGPISEHPEQLHVFNYYDAVNGTFAKVDAPLYPDKMRNLQGREVILGVFDYKPFVVVDYENTPQMYDHSEDNPNHSAHIDGTETRVLLAFCELYNCSVQVDTSEKAEWGHVFPNTSGDGLIGMIVDRKSHVGMCAMYSWYINYITIDLTAFLGRSGVTCMVPAPQRLTSWNLPFRPFQFTLWLAVCACLIVETVSLLVTRRLEQTIEMGDNSWLTSFQFGYITSLKLFVSQGSDYVVNSTSVRTVLLSCYMIDIIITSIYGGGLASILTLPSLAEAADSLERLYKHNILWIGTSYDWTVSLQAVKDPLIMSVNANYRVYTFDEMREMAKIENMGFVVERMAFGHFGNGEFLSPEALNRLKLMSDDIYFQFTIAFVPRQWPFLPNFNSLIYAWHSSGFDKFWEWKVTADYLNVNEQDQMQASMTTNFDTGPTELDLDNFAGLLLLWMVGTAVSILAFGFELLHHLWIQRQAARIVCKSIESLDLID